MANENRASYAKIGVTVFAGAIAIVLTLIYLGGLRGSGDEMLVETYYDKPVSGLSVGSVVNFRGVKIGEVREISFVGDKYKVEGADNSRIYILMAINGRMISPGRSYDEDEFREYVKTLVDQLGLRATVASSGITGLSRIECDNTCEMPSGITPPPPISWTPRRAYIPSRISLLDNLSVAATKVLNQVNQMDIGMLGSNITFAVESVAQMTDSARNMIETRQADLERLIDNLSETSAAIRDVTAELRRNPSLLIRERIPDHLSETR